MSDAPQASIIIDNYNYGRFLPDSIGSALAQTYEATEIIVVDDGSTDNSREILSGYSGSVLSILKENGGQASAFNAGFRASQGEIIFFLDADDMLVPDAVERAVAMFSDDEVIKVHWTLWEIDDAGLPTGRIIPVVPLDEGDLAERTIREGPLCYSTSPTSGNAWRRSYIENVFPVAEMGNKHGADAYLSILAPLFGKIATVGEPLGYYRVHGESFSGSRANQKRVPSLFDIHSRLLRDHLHTRGITAEPRLWKKHYYAWEFTCKELARELRRMIPPGEKSIFVEDCQLGYDLLRDRILLPFLEREGEYFGPPSGNDHAISELERMRTHGASYIAFAWPAFWWLAHYSQFHSYLRSRHRCILENERLVVFQLIEPESHIS